MLFVSLWSNKTFNGNYMDKKDIELIRALQDEEVYLTLDPFGEIAKNLGMEKTELLEAVSDLKERGAIRRFGAAMFR